MLREKIGKLIRSKKLMVSLGLMSILLLAGLVVGVEKTKQPWDITRYHEVHEEAGVYCRYCHLNPYTPQGWVEVDDEGVGTSMMMENSGRDVDKQTCMHCHRWGSRAWYSSITAEAGALYK